MDAEEQQGEADGPGDGTARKAPNATGSHDDWKEIDEENQQRHDHQQRPLKRLEFIVGWETQVEGKQHTGEPRQHQSSNQQNDQANDEAEFDPLLNFRRLEGDERHDAAETQSQHQGHEESGHAGSPLAGQPVAQRKLVRDEQFDGVKENGVVDGTHNIG